MRLREGPVQLASRLDIAPSTVHRILTTARLNRLSYVDRATGEPVRRYEHPHPGGTAAGVGDSWCVRPRARSEGWWWP